MKNEIKDSVFRESNDSNESHRSFTHGGNKRKKKMVRSEYGEGKRKGTTSRIIRGGTSRESFGW